MHIEELSQKQKEEGKATGDKGTDAAIVEGDSLETKSQAYLEEDKSRPSFLAAPLSKMEWFYHVGGWVWALPVQAMLYWGIGTLLVGWLGWVLLSLALAAMLVPTLLMMALRQIRFLRKWGMVGEFAVVKGSWLERRMANWTGASWGLFIWYRADYSESKQTVLHERRHAEQMLKLGIFFPLLYAFEVAFLYLLFPDRHPYYDNRWEWDARHSAGQPLDISWQEWSGGDRWIWW